MAGELMCLDHLEALLLLDCPMYWTWFWTDTHLLSRSSVSNISKVECRINLHHKMFVTAPFHMVRADSIISSIALVNEIRLISSSAHHFALEILSHFLLAVFQLHASALENHRWEHH